MKNYLKILIIVVIITLVLIIFIMLGLIGSTSKKKPDQEVFPTPTTELIQGELYITSIKPVDTSKIYSPAQPLEISFTQSVGKNNLKYSIVPQTQTFVSPSKNPNSLIISPLTIWQTGITKITFLNETVSENGKTLKNAQTYSLNTAAPTIPPLEGAY